MLASYRYTDFDGSVCTGECDVHECNDGFYVTGVTGLQGCSKTKSPVVYWKPVRAAIEDLLGGREMLSYSVASV